MEIYYIGGSPGSGKSTIAKMLAKQFGLVHYKLNAQGFSVCGRNP